LFLAGKNRGLESHLGSASCCGRLFWRVILASLSGTSIWRGFVASKFGEHSVGSNEMEAKKKKGKLCIIPWTCNIAS
jgi:hypothetical protein